jgi:alkaline phosphatase D
MLRRTLLKAVVAMAASSAFACSSDPDVPLPGPGAPGDLDAPGDQDVFPHGVASGDPRASSVVLWTRALPPAGASGDVTLTLEVATGLDFAELVLREEFTAMAAHDHALKVKVTGLKPRTTYYYRFTSRGATQDRVSALGRTRTAPEAGEDVPVKFVFASCQDYIGRYFNSWQHLLESNADADFIVFLGDYIYETTGDASFQNSGSPRGVSFTEPAGAISLGSGGSQFYAARSLSNYRDLYKNMRADRIIQRLHSRYAFVMMWDDHEFSDDSHGDVATYSDGFRAEQDSTRKQNAEQAFYEFLPVDPRDVTAGEMDASAEERFPNTHLYRDLSFGQNLKLVLTDYRTYRPDHLIPEEAYPGQVVLDAATLAATGAAAAFATDTFAYVDLNDAAYANQRTALRQVYAQQLKGVDSTLTDAAALERATQVVTGNVALAYANQVLTAAQPALVINPAGKPRGLAFVHMGMQRLFDSIGTRYVVVKDTFDFYAQVLYAKTGRRSEDVYGATQEAWLKQSLTTGEAWKVVVSSVSLTSMLWDLRNRGLSGAEALYAQRFYVNVDQYDGFPNKKAELLKYIGDTRAQVKNALFISGDIHAAFASMEGGVPCLTAPAISSFALKPGIAGTVAAVVGATSNVYRYAITDMEKTFQEAHPGLAFAEASSHGYVTVEVKNASEAEATFFLLPYTEVETDYSQRAGELAGKVTARRFLVRQGAITPLG